MNTNSPSSLLSLHAELWNRIYHYVVTGTEKLVLVRDKLVPHALARTNQQLRNEFLPVFEHNDFLGVASDSAHVTDLDVRPAFRLLYRIGKAKQASRAIAAECTVKIKINIESTTASWQNRNALKQWCVFCVQAQGIEMLTLKHDMRIARDDNDLRNAKLLVYQLDCDLRPRGNSGVEDLRDITHNAFRDAFGQEVMDIVHSKLHQM